MSDLTSLFTDTLAKFSFRAVLSAAATLLICLVAVHLLGKLLRRLLARTKLDERIQKYLLAGVKLILYIVTVLIVAESLNIPMTSLVALLSVGSLGVTLAAEDILGNVAGGLVILSAHPFSIGDYVEVGGVAGTVHEISLNHTKLVTPDGHLVMLPNKELASSQMTNYTVLGRRRVVQRVAASYDAPTPSPTVSPPAVASRISSRRKTCWRTRLPPSTSPHTRRALSSTPSTAGLRRRTGGARIWLWGSTCGTPSGSTAWR